NIKIGDVVTCSDPTVLNARTTVAGIGKDLTSVILSNPALKTVTPASGVTFSFTKPVTMGAVGGLPRSSDVQAYTLDFDDAHKEDAKKFAAVVYDVMQGFSHLPLLVNNYLSPSAQLLSLCVGCNIGTFGDTPGEHLPTVRVNQLRDQLKSIL